MSERADAVVIGMGPGGEDVAGRLAQAGLDVIGIERQLVGGECPYWGCVPSKMAVRAANLLAEARRIPGMAGDSSVSPDWEPVARRIRAEATDDWDDRVAVERFEAKGGRFVRAQGRIVGPARVMAGELDIEVGRAIVVATGARPVIPPIPGLADIPYWTNREALEAKEPPSSLVVLGGGAIGVELGQVFAQRDDLRLPDLPPRRGRRRYGPPLGATVGNCQIFGDPTAVPGSRSIRVSRGSGRSDD